jgi:hypothetical protein
VLVALVVGAAIAVREPKATAQPVLPPSSGGMLVLDLSASITEDTYSRIHQTLLQVVARGGRYGLVVFSNTAYEALPPGTPASALGPLVRYFALPAASSLNGQPVFPVNPWSKSFTSGTAISAGLDLAWRIELAHGNRHPAVLLVSDLADDPSDLQRLTAVLTNFRARGVKLHVIALNPALADEEYFKRLIGSASGVIPAGLSSASAVVRPPATSFPTWIVVLTVIVAALLAVNELQLARLRWGGGRKEVTA